MKKSKAQTAETRRRIVEAAARAFKRHGIHATGVAEIMAAAGMTHGGFYRHFASKEHLIAEAFAADMASTLNAMGSTAATDERTFIDHVGTCLLDKDQSECLTECPLIVMGSELARADAETRHAATRGYLELISAMAARGKTDRSAAIFAFSAILGAVTVSRIVDDPALAKLILEATNERLVGTWPEAANAVSDEAV